MLKQTKQDWTVMIQRLPPIAEERLQSADIYMAYIKHEMVNTAVKMAINEVIARDAKDDPQENQYDVVCVFDGFVSGYVFANKHQMKRQPLAYPFRPQEKNRDDFKVEMSAVMLGYRTTPGRRKTKAVEPSREVREKGEKLMRELEKIKVVNGRLTEDFTPFHKGNQKARVERWIYDKFFKPRIMR